MIPDMKRFRILLLIIPAIFIGADFGPGLAVGDFAPDFNLKNVDGKMISMAANPDNKGYVVIFTCNTCPYSKMYEQRIIDLHDTYAKKGYPVIAIQPNDPKIKPGDSFSEMKARAKNKKYPFPYVWDESQETTRLYGASRTPHVYLLKKTDSKYRVEYIGAIDNNSRDGSAATERYVEDALDALLKGNEVPVTNTKAVGCTIKWKST